MLFCQHPNTPGRVLVLSETIMLRENASTAHLQVNAMASAWGYSNVLPAGKPYDSKAWVLSGQGHPSKVNYTMQVLLYELYADGSKCEQVPDNTPLLFVDYGPMDRAGSCSQAAGGCNVPYVFNATLNKTEQGFVYGPFVGGVPNLSKVRTCW